MNLCYLPSIRLIVISLTVIAFCSCDPSPEQVPPPEQAISIEEAKILTDEFVRTRANIINDSLNITDVRDIHFSLETLKEYIAYVEQEGARQGREELGIRIYLAAYPEESEFPDPGYATVVLVPTASVEGRMKQQGILPVRSVFEPMEGTKALNFGNGGRPPNDLE